MKMVSLKQPCNQIAKSLLCPQHTQYNGKLYRCCRGYTPRYDPAGSMTRPDLALHRDPPEDWRLTGLAAHCQTTHEPDDSRMTPTAGQIED